MIPKLQREVNLLSYDIKETITKELNRREANAVKKIRSNPRYFFSFAKRLAKAKTTVGPLADKSGTLHADPTTKAELLQSQYASDPNAANVEDSTANLNHFLLSPS